MDNWRGRWCCWDWAAEGEIDVQNVPLDGPTTDPALDALDLDNITFDANEDAHVSSGEELDEDDDDGDDDIIRGLEDYT